MTRATAGGVPRWLAHPTIVTRLVLTVTGAMALVLALAAAFVFWRVQHALDLQLDQDLAAYHGVVAQAIEQRADPPATSPGEYYQVFDSEGRLVQQGPTSPTVQLIDSAGLARARAGRTVRTDIGRLLTADDNSYRVEASLAGSPTGVVIVTAISRSHRDEALRELLLQLAVTDLLALVAASYVGYRTARGALDPVERYRRAAASAGEQVGTRLPVAEDRDDELTRLGHTLNDLLARLEAATAREHQFIADASHELRTPLSLLRAEVEFALHLPRTSQELEAVLGSVGGQVDRLVALANGLLDLEQLTSGEALFREPVHVRSLVAGVAARYQPAFTAASRVLEVDVDDVTVWLDERWMELLVGNLVDNALRHGAGGVTVEARVHGDRLVLAVEDSGLGFPSDFADRAFDRFSRAEESRSTRGSGLGLSVVSAVASAHGGSSRVSRDGASSRVEVELPAEQGDVPARTRATTSR